MPFSMVSLSEQALMKAFKLEVKDVLKQEDPV